MPGMECEKVHPLWAGKHWRSGGFAPHARGAPVAIVL